MLIGLAFFDSGYLVGSILESFRKGFLITTDVHIYLFPYFLYPGQARKPESSFKISMDV